MNDYKTLLSALDAAIAALRSATQEDSLDDANNLCGYLGWYSDSLANSLEDAGINV